MNIISPFSSSTSVRPEEAKAEANPALTSVERLYTILRLLDVELVLADRSTAQTPVNQIDPLTMPASKLKNDVRPPAYCRHLVKKKCGKL